MVYSYPYEKEKSKITPVDIISLLFVIAIVTLSIVAFIQAVREQKTDDCYDKVTVAKVEPVGHRNYSTYFTTFSDGRFKNIIKLHQIGETLCFTDIDTSY